MARLSPKNGLVGIATIVIMLYIIAIIVGNEFEWIRRTLWSSRKCRQCDAAKRQHSSYTVSVSRIQRDHDIAIRGSNSHRRCGCDTVRNVRPRRYFESGLI